MFRFYNIVHALYNVTYVHIDTQGHQVTETQAELQERVNVQTKWTV